MLKFFEFSISDDNPVMNQVHELLVLISRLQVVKVEILETFQVRAIIAKLPFNWND